MCYEFDEFYRRAREAEEARKRKLADESKRESSPPAKPAGPGKGVERKEPVPA